MKAIMNITVNAPKASVQTGMGLFDLLLGTDQFASLRQGDKVPVTCTDGEVEGTITSVTIGVLGQFLSNQPGAFVGTVGRPADVRAVADELERRNPKAAQKAVDPRTLYTYVYVSVPYAPIVTPAPALAA